jgi:hypothetical protein
MRKFVWVVVFSALAANAQTALQLRAGESVNGFPNWAERVVLEWMNRARVDPQSELANCPACGERACYTPQPPLYWSEQLNHAARFHAAEMTQQQYFAHDSKCTVVQNIDSLYPVACDGSASCGCVGGAVACADGGCTPWYQRVGLFGVGALGEIIASSGVPNAAFYLWLYETSGGSTCSFSLQNGHRFLILTSSGAVGAGLTGNEAVGDFGGGGVAYKIPSAAHYPQQAASVELWANWYDTAAPRTASAIVDGRCLPLSLQRGSPQNGAWSAMVSNVGSGCHRYYFSFIDSTGTEVTYPATGSLGIGCADWDTSRVRASCSGSMPRRRSARH